MFRVTLPLGATVLVALALALGWRGDAASAQVFPTRPTTAPTTAPAPTQPTEPPPPPPTAAPAPATSTVTTRRAAASTTSQRPTTTGVVDRATIVNPISDPELPFGDVSGSGGDISPLFTVGLSLLSLAGFATFAGILGRQWYLTRPATPIRELEGDEAGGATA